MKGAYNKKDCKAIDFASFFTDATKAKKTSRAPAPGSDFSVSEKTLERFTATMCVYLVWHCVEEFALNINDSSSWPQVRAAEWQHCRICTAAGLPSWLLLYRNACWHINFTMYTTRLMYVGFFATPHGKSFFAPQPTFLLLLLSAAASAG
jgi:hypothetical protein